MACSTSAGHVESVDDDQLAGSVDQEQVAAAEIADVARAEPPLGIGTALACRPVAREQIVTTNEDLAGFSGFAPSPIPDLHPR